jgi:hypothetical protein
MRTRGRRRLELMGRICVGAVLVATSACIESDTVASCSPYHESRGRDGTVSFSQNTPRSRIAWGVYANDQFVNDNGYWEVTIYSDNVPLETKKQDYAPHGSVHPDNVKPGKILRIAGFVTSGSSLGYDYNGNIDGICRMT